MSESQQDDLGREVDAAMRMFEKSQVGEAAAITPIQPSRVLLVLDGSPQDATAIDSVAYLRERFNTETLVLDGRISGEDDITAAVIDRVTGSRPIKAEGEEPYDKVLAALKSHDVDMVILPCPFGRDLEKVGTDSAGTVIDVLLSRCAVPMLVIRRNDQTLGECVNQVSVVVGSECDVVPRAAAWAFGLSAERGTVGLNLVIEKEQFENIRSIVEALSEETTLDNESFTEALTKAHHAIHQAMAKTATSLSRSYHLRPLAGEISPPNPMQNQDRLLIVLPLEVDDRYGQGFAHDRIRRSPHPVLVIPGHVETSTE
ncbi:universal stress protein [Roseiconus lacunae]|uniref:Universal stress protein n=1 Tax=Roseiconus lacunae TaxID=2605694 RepID=A0ABT7PFV0_9BACT|nr:universal stress protein [Roseiconus lacunae]MDM4015367.1 universal stress protein [Roseiconus lacunae]